jgi:phage/plasmid-like protein (TIGR03299 family)
MVACESIQLAGDHAPETRRIHSHKAIVRQDTASVLGVVGGRYVPIQNFDAFGWLDVIVDQRMASFETAGFLHGGKTVWMLLKLPEQLQILDTDDLVMPYLLAVNTHDGSRAMRVFTTAVRVICQNTLTLALQRAGSTGLTLRHTEGAIGRIQEARRVLEITREQLLRFKSEADALARVQIGQRQLAGYFETLWPDPPTAKDNTKAVAVRRRLLENFQDDRQRLPGIRGTLWAAFNAVSQWTDHERMARGSVEPSRDDNRLQSIWLGDSADLKRAAWNTALELAFSIS